MVPCSTAFCADADNRRHGVSVRNPTADASPSSSRPKYSADCPPAHGAMAPSARLASGSGTTSSGSTSFFTPIPEQSGQAP